MDVKEEGLIRGDIGEHWYYKSKARALTRLLGQASFGGVLDVGAGSGFFSKHLLAHGAATDATCVDTAYDTDSVEAVGGKPVRFVRELKPSEAGLVLLMDVLEHVDDDLQLLQQVMDCTRSGSRFVISVPAFPFLWSKHDDFLGHKRRYTLSSLRRAVEAAGLKVDALHYFYGFVFPLVVAVRMFGKLRRKTADSGSDLRQHSAPVNGMLSAVCGLETSVMRFNKLMGLTVFCLCHKS